MCQICRLPVHSSVPSTSWLPPAPMSPASITRRRSSLSTIAPANGATSSPGTSPSTANSAKFATEPVVW